MFQKLDTDNDGYLTLAEFRKVAEMRDQGAAKKPAEKAPPAIGFNDQPTPEQLAFFEKKIRPVLAEHCYQCHAQDAKKLRGGLLLDTRDGARHGGDSGPAIVPGAPGKSLLVQAVRHQDKNLQMPPKQKLPDAVIADLEQWVRIGAPDPRAGMAKAARTDIDIEKGRQFWAFQPPKKAALPAVKDEAWPQADVDRFVLAALEAKGLRPVADAETRTLLRRVYFDLIGLPPSPEEAEAFVKEAAAKPQAAIERVVDGLLASPRFGERWGRHWLDVARYAESTGRQVNFSYPHAWRYREYVIAAFNADKPFDRLVREQLAGDLLPAATERQKAEQMVATGFLALGPRTLNEPNTLQYQLDMADEQIEVTTQAFLGLTAACARCHDHKFDPIPQKDYYALAGIFRSTETCYGTVRAVQGFRPAALLNLPADPGPPTALDKLSAAERSKMEQQLAGLKKEKETLLKQPGGLFTTKEGIRNAALTAALESRLALYDADGTPKRLAMGVRERLLPADSPVYQRGEVDKPGDVVPRGFLQVLSTRPVKIASGSGRLDLADWIAARDNPLTARVLVNRAWLHLFGRGLVPTPDNFGAAGTPPTHPELLDYLAVTFMEDGWSVKKLLRRLVLSRAYRLGGDFDAKNYEVDPDNALVWRHTKRRLDAEALRDAMLAASGQLDLTPPRGSPMTRGGDGYVQGVMPFVQPLVANFKGRSVYLPIVRDMLPEALALFDMADPSTVVAERPSTTVPAQGLYLLNNPFVLKTAEALADRLLKTPGPDADRIRQAYQRCYARVPTDEERAAAESFLAAYAQAQGRDGNREAWVALCQALFAGAEFLYIN